MIKLGTYSRFKNTKMVIFDGEEVFGRWSPPSILAKKLNTVDITAFKVTNETAGRPDKISMSFYGVSELDWLIIAFNRPMNVLNWPKSGDVILIPSATVALAEIL